MLVLMSWIIFIFGWISDLRLKIRLTGFKIS